MRADVERVQHERHNIHYRHGRYAHATDIDDIGVWCMNELVTLEHIQKGIATEEVFELIEDFKTAKERIETLKYQFEELNKKYGVRLWETDCFKMTHIDETESSRVDTKRMKETFFDVVDANTGDVHRVNAYDFFVKKVKVKAHASLEEKK